MGTLLRPKKRTSPPLFGPCLLWPNGSMNQEATWYGGRPRPRPHCVRLDPAPPPNKKATAAHIFGPCLLWPNGWMNQDATWYGGRPRPRRHCVSWAPSSPSRKRYCGPHFLPRVYCGQTARWIEIPLGTEVLGFGPGEIDLDGNPAPPHGKGHSSPSSHISAHFTAARSPISAAAEHLRMLRLICFQHSE